MPVTPQQLVLARAAQDAAAHDARPQVRLIAGPGTGKSFTIEDRVHWLLQNGVNPQSIFAISFTNASAQDLRIRIGQYCQARGQDGSNVSVTTLHSLALRMLRTAGLLARFPSPPLVLDQWEIEEIFTSEFCAERTIGSRRADHIRRDHGALWSTGTFNPPNYIPPAPPISEAERASLTAFLTRFEQVYSCILPGEIIRECVNQIRAGLVVPCDLVPIQQLIVDEYQDLNPIDLEFIDSIIAGGASAFVAGDDDQSIYSFRFALPQGIQSFPETYPDCGQHSLNYCFRCSTEVLRSAQAVIDHFPSANRIPKDVISVYRDSLPPLPGTVLRWSYQTGVVEAQGIARSCRALIDAGMAPSDILILLSDTHLLKSAIVLALEGVDIPCDVRADDHLSTEAGRILYDLIRIICNPNDYVAHRSLLGLLPGVGLGTCASIKEKVVVNNINYRAMFYAPLPNGVFSNREISALNRISAICADFAEWASDDSLAERAERLTELTATFGEDVQSAIRDVFASVPMTLTINEFRELFVTTSDEVRNQILAIANERMDEEQPPLDPPISKVRLMTMHGAKGLSARVVFIPGLEEQVFPGLRRQPYPGLIEEAARLLYVSITRARAACIMTFARRRMVHGTLTQHAPSRFNAHTGGAFVVQGGGLAPALAARIVADCLLL